MSTGAELDAEISALQSQITQLAQAVANGVGGGAAVSTFNHVENLRINCPFGGTTYTVTFDSATLNGMSAPLPPASFTINANTVGLNGLDAGQLRGSGAWYYLHLVTDGTTIGGVMSPSATAPILPAGMLYSMLIGVGQVVSINPTVLLGQFQVGNRVTIQAYGVMKSTGVAANASGVWQSLNLAQYIPPNAKTISGTLGGNGSPARDMVIELSPLGTDVGRIAGLIAGYPAQQSFDAFGCTVPFSDFALWISQLIYWRSSDTAARNVLYLTDFTI